MDGEHPIFKATRQLCDQVNQTLKIATNDIKNDISISKNEITKKRLRRSHRVTSGEIDRMFTDNYNQEAPFSLEIAKSIITSTTDLTITARNINSKCNDFRLKSLIQVVTKQHIEAAIRLVQRYKISSINVHCLLCQKQLQISLDDIDRTLERMISVCSNLYPSRRQLEELIAPATATREALNTLNASICKSINRNENPVLIEEPTDLTQSAKILGEATAQVLLAIKEIIREKPNWKGKKFLIDAAVVLSDTTTRLVKYAQFSILYSELKHILSSIESLGIRLRNGITHDFLQILQFMARETTKFSITNFNLAKKIYVNTKTLITFSFLNESLTLIYLTENFIKIIKKANSSPLTPDIYRKTLEHSTEFIQEAKWVLDSLRNVISSLTTRS